MLEGYWSALQSASPALLDPIRQAKADDVRFRDPANASGKSNRGTASPVSSDTRRHALRFPVIESRITPSCQTTRSREPNLALSAPPTVESLRSQSLPVPKAERRGSLVFMETVFLSGMAMSKIHHRSTGCDGTRLCGYIES